MKTKYFFLILLLASVVLVSCDDDNKNTITPSNYDSLDLYIRGDANNALIPLKLGNSWIFKKNLGSEEKPDNFIKNLLLDDEIIDQKILPVRAYDTNSGNASYLYYALCYITKNNLAYFFMNDRIKIGTYLKNDANGKESVSDECELPISYTETSSGYYVLDRKSLNDDAIPTAQKYLYECPGYYIVDAELEDNNIKRYKDCKRFTFENKQEAQSPVVRTNVFYFKDGIGLIKYQQYFKMNSQATDSALVYEQILNTVTKDTTNNNNDDNDW
ncbi:MAG: hypothetical protein IJK61_01325 [Bacteroidetes bacterium]|nr:hypothetical protein [Bacteroidota bacterium]